MDELQHYMQKANKYKINTLEKILDKKIIITENHIKNIKNMKHINIIELFEKYGYVFTNDDYIYLINIDGCFIKYINNKYYELCKLAVKQNGIALQYIPLNILTDELCEIAVRQNGYALKYVPKNKKTSELCEIAIRQNCDALQFVKNNIITNEMCTIVRMQENKRRISSNTRFKL